MVPMLFIGGNDIDVAINKQRIVSSTSGETGEARHQMWRPGIEGKDISFKSVLGEQTLKVLDASGFVVRQVRGIKPEQVLKDF